MLFQSGGCCDGSSPDVPARRRAADRPRTTSSSARSAGCPFYIDAEQDERWNRPRFVLDVAPGPASGFSLEGLDGIHFLTRS